MSTLSNPFQVPESEKQAARQTHNEKVWQEINGVQQFENIIPTERVKRRSGESPVHAWIRSLGRDFMLTKEVAEELGISSQMVRKLTKPDANGKRVTSAPSYVLPYGKTYVYLFTPEDVEALREYVQRRRTVFYIEDVDQKIDPNQISDRPREQTAKQAHQLVQRAQRQSRKQDW